jgi:hypothetical protein
MPSRTGSIQFVTAHVCAGIISEGRTGERLRAARRRCGLLSVDSSLSFLAVVPIIRVATVWVCRYPTLKELHLPGFFMR